ncbi:MAG: hypothetical protein ACLVGA_13265, partial [Dysosmobacter sp.]
KAVKGTVKTIDRAAVAAERLKSAAVRTKNAAERSATPAETSSQEYGAQKLERTAQSTVSELDFQFRKRGRRGFSDARRNADKARAQMQKCRDVLGENKSKKAVQAPHAPKPAKTVRTGARPIQRTGRIVIKPPVGSEAAQVAKAAAKTAPKAVQTVKAAAKAAVQTVQRTARATALPQRRLSLGQRLSSPLRSGRMGGSGNHPRSLRGRADCQFLASVFSSPARTAARDNHAAGSAGDQRRLPIADRRHKGWQHL